MLPQKRGFGRDSDDSEEEEDEEDERYNQEVFKKKKAEQEKANNQSLLQHVLNRRKSSGGMSSESLSDEEEDPATVELEDQIEDMGLFGNKLKEYRISHHQSPPAALTEKKGSPLKGDEVPFVKKVHSALSRSPASNPGI